MSRLVVASNRVVTNASRATAGGLAVALQAALRETGGVWTGWSGKFDDEPLPEPTTSSSGGITYATFDLPRDDYEDYYNGFANRALWPLFHYRTDLATYDRRFYAGYQRVNRFFARATAAILAPDDIVWVHDYHLILLGEELRRLGCRQAIGYFLHIPFPATEVLLTLPNHRALVGALFAYDVIGFQTRSDLRSFADYVVHEAEGEVIGKGLIRAFGRTIRAEVFPIGIDTGNFLQMARSEEAERTYKRMRESVTDRRLIIGVDRLDYTKGLLERFHAIERLFEYRPELRGKVSMLQIAPPSRTGVPEYETMRQDLEAITGRINGQLAEFDWVPIRYANQIYSRRALAGLFRASAVGLVTPFRDGMNLVAKEFVVAQNPDDPGVLVLSRFAGAAHEMPEALIVNPYDTDDVVLAIDRALTMPLAERRQRHSDMMANLRRYDVFTWRDNFVAALHGAKDQVRLGAA